MKTSSVVFLYLIHTEGHIRLVHGMQLFAGFLDTPFGVHLDLIQKDAIRYVIQLRPSDRNGRVHLNQRRSDTLIRGEGLFFHTNHDVLSSVRPIGGQQYRCSFRDQFIGESEPAIPIRGIQGIAMRARNNHIHDSSTDRRSTDRLEHISFYTCVYCQRIQNRLRERRVSEGLQDRPLGVSRQGVSVCDRG